MKRAWLIILVGLLALPASAHELKAGLTRVLFNERSGNLEVMHRLLLHDAEHACRQLFDGQADLIGDPVTLERFSAYVREGFQLAIDDELVELAYVGAEIDGRHIWVYQEAPIPASVGHLSIDHRVLRDVWAEQSNLVNIEGRGPIRSLRFSGNDGVQSIAMTDSAARLED
ncbi:DUF6702 family protein [Wenzhouxiangella marina]|uniref:Uncharacterized protein n=1 Tax=Wenzhouxiangella marina TaxID=1579979 RepID=A0A0K0XUE6_9GAMM|nr:DUF6702 family protein [Wenzhouxiangella marina]AKS41308.1 hypothetical protein WM2015_927 [Wenzhouxiangella marina]MBB6086942.1 hypothetical protein [Wenzhouxiangella marina]